MAAAVAARGANPTRIRRHAGAAAREQATPMSDHSRDTDVARHEPVLVWDLPVRVTHWALVITVAGAWATHYAGTAWFAWHRRLGYATLVLVAFRVVWGFIGTRHARFASFLRGPRAILAYLRSGAPAAAGHNPLGALSVVAMLAALLVQAATGLCANDEIASAGPFYGWLSPVVSDRITAVHVASSNVLLGLIVLHLVAIAWYERALRRPLVRAMVSGRVSGTMPAPGGGLRSSRIALALAIVAVLAGLLAIAVRAAPEATIALY
jgi:cytochrome b